MLRKNNTADKYTLVKKISQQLGLSEKINLAIINSLIKEILIELKKERIYNISQLTPKKLREILKKLKQNKYYEHIPHIINKLNGTPAPIMSFKTEEELRRMFKEIQIPFQNYCPPDRKTIPGTSWGTFSFKHLIVIEATSDKSD